MTIVGVGFLVPRLLLAGEPEPTETPKRSIVLLSRPDSGETDTTPPSGQESNNISQDTSAEELEPTPGAPGATGGGGGAPISTYDIMDQLTNDEIRDVVVWTDRPIAENRVSRDWVWGPGAISGPIDEPFEGDDQSERTVQYFEKGRLEVAVHRDGMWPVTGGLLAVEMISGSIQVGIDSFDEQPPAEITVFGDGETGPAYADLVQLLDQEPLGEGEAISQRIAADGRIEDVPFLARRGFMTVHPDEAGEHSIAEPFWEFMNARGEVFDGEDYVTEDLFPDPYFATGRPITEPFWVDVGGDALGQCFERRCLVYGPSEGSQWQVQSNDIGLDYFTWRYGVGVGL
ncbi:MAG: hypothetical protein ACOC9Y_04555 [Chloroflexota bacterium]